MSEKENQDTDNKQQTNDQQTESSFPGDVLEGAVETLLDLFGLGEKK